MVALVRGILSTIVALLAVGFALCNRHDVLLTWSPFADPLPVPLFVVGLGGLGLGFISGALLLWLRGLGARLSLRRHKRRIETLERDLKETSERDAFTRNELPAALATGESNGMDRI